MKKTGIAWILSVCMIINLVSMPAFAVEGLEFEPSNDSEYINIGAYTVGNNVTVNQLLEQSKFTARQGHGFAAERGNNLIDCLKGQNATIVGDNNIKNGADRKILGRYGSKIWIQDKYYSSAEGSIDACFDESKLFRYVDADGNAMQIEVPCDQYENAVERMRDKIKNGQLKNVGITDPDDAENIVRKGSLTYKQAVNLAKAGTIESLTYDAVNGTVSAGCAFGISSLIVYSVSRLNGVSPKAALKTSAIQGVKAGGVAFGTYVISSQLLRTNVFMPNSEALVKALGDDFATAILNSVGKEPIGVGAGGNVVKLPKTTIQNQAARILRNQALTASVTIILLSAGDVVDIIRGRISAEQLLKNLAVATAGVVGGYAGSALGGVAGSAVAPGAGTTVGSVIGGVVGGGVAGYGAEMALGFFVKEDADKMMEIIEDNFSQLAQDYLLNEKEANAIADALKEELTGDNLKDMFASEDQNQYAQKMIEPLVQTEISKRNTIKAPTEAELRTELKDSLKGVVYIH